MWQYQQNGSWVECDKDLSAKIAQAKHNKLRSFQHDRDWLVDLTEGAEKAVNRAKGVELKLRCASRTRSHRESGTRRADACEMPAAGKPSAPGRSSSGSRTAAPATGAQEASVHRSSHQAGSRSGHAASQGPGVPATSNASRAVGVPKARGHAPATSGVPPPPPRRGDWFSDLFGFQETSPETVKAFIQVYPVDLSADVKMRSIVNGRVFSVGNFSTPSLRELRSQGQRVRSLRGRIVFRNELGDVSEKHALRENRFATFQAASQFNCLEFVHQDVTPELGVSRYVHDKTQGPACSIACGPATVYRNYFAPVVKADGSLQEGQSHDCMINNLSNLSRMLGNEDNRFFKVKGGYTMSSEGQLGQLNLQLNNLKRSGKEDELRESINIGVHQDVQVTSSVWGSRPQDDEEHTVTQVFASACAVDYNPGTKPQSWEGLATLVLDATYEATLWTAVLQADRHKKEFGSNKVFLTAVGGGVFGNPMPWIGNALAKALKKMAQYDLEVIMVTYAGRIDPVFRQLEKEFSGRP